MVMKRGHERPAAVSGLFYPGSSQGLMKAVRDYLQRARDSESISTETSGLRVRAILVPHAGYVYSGQTAALAFSTISEPPRRVIMLGPAHRVGFRGISAADFSRYCVPSGFLEVDRDALAPLLDADVVTCVPEAHHQEHSLEVMVPFLLECMGQVPILPFLVGHSSPEAVERLLQHVVQQGDLVLISSDLSHFHPYDIACETDHGTLDAFRLGQWQTLNSQRACGHLGLAGTMRFGQRQGWEREVLDYRNSGDTAGDKDRVVGYGGGVFYEPAPL